MRKQKPRFALLDEVKISRDGECANIEYIDQSVGPVSYKIGPKISQMTDREILDMYNSTIISMEMMRSQYKHVAIEIPVGKPQIQYESRSDQWVPRGDVLRCVIEDGGPNYEATIWIDDQELSLQEFGRLLLVHNGWGMRIVFVPDDEIHKPPVIEVKEPDEKDR